MSVPLRPYPPPPSSLKAVGIFQEIQIKVLNKYFFLNGLKSPFPPINGITVKKRPYFGGFPKEEGGLRAKGLSGIINKSWRGEGLG